MNTNAAPSKHYTIVDNTCKKCCKKAEHHQRFVSRLESVLVASLTFKEPKDAARATLLVPQGREGWLNFLVQLAKKKVVIKFLTDKELRKVVIRSRPQLGRGQIIYEDDPDTPECYYWTEQQVGNWIAETHPHLKEAFLKNYINGRRLVMVDASALSKMGLRNFDEIQEVAKKIRHLLGLHRSNIMRAVMRRVPLELYLKKRSHNGRTYDALTFKSFCEAEKFPYKIIVGNKNALIPCTTSVLISSGTQASKATLEDEAQAGDDDMSSEGASVKNAPTVEYLVRSQLIRNRAVQVIIEEMFECIFDPKCAAEHGGLQQIASNAMSSAFLELGFGDLEAYTRERVEFATEVARELICDLTRTAEVLRDINKFKLYMKSDMTDEEIVQVKEFTEEFIEEVAPIAGLLALQEFSLELLFRKEPDFEECIDGVIGEAEDLTNKLVPTAEDLVDSVLSEAKLRLMAMEDFPNLGIDAVRSARELARQILDDLTENMDEAVREAHPDYDDEIYESRPDSSFEEGLKPLMYLQGGKLIFGPDNTVIGRVDQNGVVREMEGGMVVSQIHANGNVIGPNEELLGRIGKKYDVISGITRPTHQTGFRIGLGPTDDHSGPSEALYLAKKISFESKMKDLTRQAVNLAILELFREKTMHTLITPDGKNVIGKIYRDGRLIDEKGETLAFLHTNGKLYDPIGALYEAHGILLDEKLDVIGMVSDGQIKLAESLALEKIQSEEVKRAWEAIKARTTRRLLSENGNVYTIEYDGSVRNRSGAVIGSLLLDGRLLQSDSRPFPKGLVLIGSNERIIGTVEDEHLKVLRSNSMEKRQKVLDTLRDPAGGAERKLVFSADGQQFVGWLALDGSVVNEQGEPLAQLLLNGEFLGRNSKPWGPAVILSPGYRNLLARVSAKGTVQLLEESPDNFQPIKAQDVKKFLKRGSISLVDNARRFIAMVSPNNTLISKTGRIIGKLEGTKMFKTDGTPLEGLLVDNQNQVHGSVQNGELKVPRRFSKDIYTKLLTVLGTKETKKMYSTAGDLIAEVTPDFKLMNRGQELAQLSSEGTFMRPDGRVFHVTGVIRGVDQRVLANLEEDGHILVPEETTYDKIKPEEVEKLLADSKTQLFTPDQTIFMGDLTFDGSVTLNGVVIGKVRPNGILETTTTFEKKFYEGFALISSGKVIGKVFPNQTIQLLRRGTQVEKPDEAYKSRVGNAFRLITEDGRRLIGEITSGLQLVCQGMPVAELHPEMDQFVRPNNMPFNIPGLLIRSDGRIVGRVTDTGDIILDNTISVEKIRKADLKKFKEVLRVAANLRLVTKDGKHFGTFRSDGSVISPVKSNTTLGRIQSNGLLLKGNNTYFPPALIINAAGEMIGRLNDAGSLRLLTKQEHDKINLAKLQILLKSGNQQIYSDDGEHFLGELTPEGHLMKHGAAVAELQPDGRLVLPTGQVLGFVNRTDAGKLVVRRVNEIIIPKPSSVVRPSAKTSIASDQTSTSEAPSAPRTSGHIDFMPGLEGLISDLINDATAPLGFANDAEPAGPTSGQAAKPSGPSDRASGQPVRMFGPLDRTSGQPVRIFGPSDQTSGQTVRMFGPSDKTSGQPAWSSGPSEQTSGQPAWSSGPSDQTSGQPAWSSGPSEQTSDQPRQQSADPAVPAFKAPRKSISAGLFQSKMEDSAATADEATPQDTSGPSPITPKSRRRSSDNSKKQVKISDLVEIDAHEEKKDEFNTLWDDFSHKGQARFVSNSLVDYYGDIKPSGELVLNNEVVGRMLPGRVMIQNNGQPFTSGLIVAEDGQIFAQVEPEGRVNLLSAESVSAIKAENIANRVLKTTGQELYSPDGEKIADITASGNLIQDGQVIAQLIPETSRFVKVDGTEFEISGILVQDGKQNARVDKGQVNVVIPAVQQMKEQELKEVMEMVASAEQKTLVDRHKEFVAKIIGNQLMTSDGKVIGSITSKGQVLEEGSGAPITGAIIGQNKQILANVGKYGAIKLMDTDDYEQMKADEIWNSVRSGELRRIVTRDGRGLIAEVTPNGDLVKDVQIVGKLTSTGHILMNSGKRLEDGLVLRMDGVVIGSVEEHGMIHIRDINEYQAIGVMSETGQILSNTKEVVGQVVSDGRVYNMGKLVAQFTNHMEFLNRKGIPFAKATGNGTVYKLEVIYQPDYVPDPGIVHMFEDPTIQGSGPESEAAYEYGTNAIEDALLRSAEAEPHSTQRGIHSRRFKRYRTSFGASTRIDAKDRSQDKQAMYMSHHRINVQTREFMKTRNSGVNIMNEIANRMRRQSLDGKPHPLDLNKGKLGAVEKSMHRRELVEQWARTLNPDEGSDNMTYVIPEEATEEERLLIIRTTADKMVNTIMQMALTHVLLQAEAGVDTTQSMAALELMKLKPGEHVDNAQTMWTPHLPSALAIEREEGASGFGGAAKRVMNQQRFTQALGIFGASRNSMLPQEAAMVKEHYSKPGGTSAYSEHSTSHSRHSGHHEHRHSHTSGPSHHTAGHGHTDQAHKHSHGHSEHGHGQHHSEHAHGLGYPPHSDHMHGPVHTYPEHSHGHGFPPHSEHGHGHGFPAHTGHGFPPHSEHGHSFPTRPEHMHGPVHPHGLGHRSSLLEHRLGHRPSETHQGQPHAEHGLVRPQAEQGFNPQESDHGLPPPHSGHRGAAIHHHYGLPAPTHQHHATNTTKTQHFTEPTAGDVSHKMLHLTPKK